MGYSCAIWFAGIFDKGMNSLRDLFYPLNHAGIPVKLSTLSQANKTRDPQIIWHFIIINYCAVSSGKELVLCPFDATVIPPMNKLF